jgi:hypothetical protein
MKVYNAASGCGCLCLYNGPAKDATMFGVISYANEGVYTNTAESERGTIHQLKFHRSNRSRRPTTNINSVHEYLLFLIPLYFFSLVLSRFRRYIQKVSHNVRCAYLALLVIFARIPRYVRLN